jgi:glycerate kinase
MNASSSHTSDPLRIVIAPDSFKGTVDAATAAEMLAEGWLRVRPHDAIALRPMADGGEGTVGVIAASTESELRTVVVRGPGGALASAQWAMLPARRALIELASTSGLTLLSEPAPWTAGTEGFGQAIRAALNTGPEQLLLALGGSASTDGGAGMLTALGGRLLDACGDPIPPGARGLIALDSVDMSGLRPLPPAGAVILSDVTSPAVGPAGSSAVYGPQKGVMPHEVAVVDRAVERLAMLLGIDPTMPGTGAAGATALALVAWGATLSSGAEVVAEMIGLDGTLADADLVITGEGKFDGQTASGKVAAVVVDHAVQAGVPVALVAGIIEAPVSDFIEAMALVEIAGSVDAARADAQASLVRAGEVLALRWPRTHSYRGATSATI